MTPNSACSRALSVLLVLVAVLSPAASPTGSACTAGSFAGAAGVGESCCCGPAPAEAPGAPACHGGPKTSDTSRKTTDCDCSAGAPPTAPVQSAPLATTDHAHEAALPPRHVEPLLAVRPAAVTPEFRGIRSDHAVSLLRLHCVNQI